MSESEIDLSQLPPPTVVEPLDYETIYAERKAAFLALLPVNEQAVMEQTLALESEPVSKLLQESAYRELILRQRINEAARAVMLAFAAGADLDHLAALYGVLRQWNGDIFESDTALRARVQLAPEGFTVAGPKLSYEFHTRSVSTDIRSVNVYSSSPGQVDVVILTYSNDGIATDQMIGAVYTALSHETIRPLCDRVVVARPTLITYSITATLLVGSGSDSETIRQAALAAVTNYTSDNFRAGFTVPISGIYSSLHQPGVIRVEMESPIDDIECAPGQAARCTNIYLTVSVI